MISRRTLVKTVPALGLLPLVAKAAKESELIYLSPVKSDGNLSSCQAEIWFIGDGEDFYVVTANDAWRAEAIGRGLTQAKVWVGDVGQWKSSRGKYKELPSVMTTASVVNDPVEHARLLTAMGDKYAREWGTWGPRFKRGLADGSRVMLRYSPVA